MSNAKEYLKKKEKEREIRMVSKAYRYDRLVPVPFLIATTVGLIQDIHSGMDMAMFMWGFITGVVAISSLIWYIFLMLAKADDITKIMARESDNNNE